MTACPTRVTTLISNLSAIATRITTATFKVTPPRTKPVRLVAVSKLKPASDILAVYNSPTHHLHFGENYLQELLEKSRLLPLGIKWHFIGGLQSNKCVTLARDVRGLWAVESVDSERKASLLDKGWRERLESTAAEAGFTHPEPADLDVDATAGSGPRLRVYVQVNTSGEASKSGVEPGAAPALCRFIRDQCPRLKLQGIMTIGAIARSKATTPETENDDFLCLRDTRDRIVTELELQGPDAELELSMGMSEDFESAIALGSDEVRVGTTIFGERPSKAQARAQAKVV